MTDTRYLYSVNPHKPIVLPNTLPIRAPKSLYLSLDEVKLCLQRGSVYRRFADIGRNERVNTLNVERLHNEKFMTEEEYEKFLEDNVAYKRGTISENEEKESVETPVSKEEKVEEVSETPVEEKVESEVSTSETVEETTEESVETPVEEAVESEEVEEGTTEKSEEDSTEEEKKETSTQNYNKNNNRRRHK